MKKLLIALSIVLVLVIGAVFAARHFALSYLTPDFVVRTIEARWNCRAEVDSVDIRVGPSTTIEIKQLALAPRDDFANAGTPLDERPKLDSAAVRIAMVKLEARPGDLLKRRLKVEHLLIDKAEVVTELGEDGGASVDSLFETLESDAGEEVVTPSVAVESETAGEEEEEAEFVAGDMKISTAAALVELRDSSMTIAMRKSGAVAHLSDLSIAFKDIDLDPENLHSHNSANFEFGGSLAIDGELDGKPERYLQLKVSGSGSIAPFNSDTGALEPAWSSTLVLHQGSRVETFPLVEKLQKELADIDTSGVDLSEFNLRGELTADTSTRLAHRQGRFTLEQPLPLSFPDTIITLDAGSWADSGTNQHEVNGVVAASDELTAKVVAELDQYLAKKTKGLVSGGFSETILGPVMTDGKIAIGFISVGDLSDPKADIVTPFGKLTELKDTLDGLKDAFKGLFGK